MIRVLRPSGASALISARVFDDSFARNLAPAVLVQPVDAAAWLDSIFGTAQLRPGDPATQEAFRKATRHSEFLCPNYDAIPLLPLLLYVRNLSGSAIRLLLIAHAPGAYGLEWALLRPLLRPGDRIVAPTLSARQVIEFLCPELLPYTCVVPHPIRPLPRPRVRPDCRPYLVSLSRIHPSKLLHRQIEALAILREKRFPDLRMRIAGPLHSPATPYACSLMAKIARLKLQGTVELTGEIDGARHKAEFLGEARLLVNLSITIEESFGKAIVEAGGCGVPVLGAHWDGFPETVGPAGACVPVDSTKLGVDVPAGRIADAIEALLEAPPAARVCRGHAACFHPRRVRRLYAQELERALEAPLPQAGSVPAAECPGAPLSGLLSATAPLTRFSWNELFALHLGDAVRLRQALNGIVHADASEADELRSLLILGVRAPLSRRLAGAELGTMDQPVGAQPNARAEDTDFFARVGTAASSRATLSSRLACLALLAGTGRLEQLQPGLDVMRADRLPSWGLRYLEADALRQRGEYERAFRKCTEPEDADGWGELAAHRVRQLAAICREWRKPGLALARLRSWLDRFPDSPDSGPVWLDRCLNAAAAGPELLEEARLSLESARLQLGASADLTQLEACIHGLEAPLK